MKGELSTSHPKREKREKRERKNRYRIEPRTDEGSVKLEETPAPDIYGHETACVDSWSAPRCG